MKSAQLMTCKSLETEPRWIQWYRFRQPRQGSKVERLRQQPNFGDRAGSGSSVYDVNVEVTNVSVRQTKIRSKNQSGAIVACKPGFP
jgi:hypothetical protein